MDLIDVLAPGIRDDPAEYADRVYCWLSDGDGSAWKKWGGCPIEGVSGHLDAAVGADELWHDGRPVRACGIGYGPHVRLGWMSFDLDGGYEIEVVRAALVGVVGSALSHPSGGTPGRERLLVRLAVPLTVSQIARAGAVLAERAGFPLKAGALEVYPAAGNGRLPFGDGACRGLLYVHRRAIEVSPAHPGDLLRLFMGLPAVDVSRYAGDPPMQAHCSARRTLKGRRTMPRDAREYLARGANVGERDHAIRALILGFMFAERSPDQILKILRDRADELFGRTRAGAQAVRRDLPRQIRNITSRYRNRRPAPVGLTPMEAARLQSLCERKATTPAELRALLRFGARALERFKGAQRAGWRQLQVHHSEWIAWANGDRGLYARLRALLGFFHSDGSYVPTARAFHPGDARSMRWRCTFAFDRGAKAPQRRISSERRPVLAVRAAARRAAAGVRLGPFQSGGGFAFSMADREKCQITPATATIPRPKPRAPWDGARARSAMLKAKPPPD